MNLLKQLHKEKSTGIVFTKAITTFTKSQNTKSNSSSNSGHVSRTRSHLGHKSTATKDLKSSSKGELFDADEESINSGRRVDGMDTEIEEIINLNGKKCSRKLSSVQGLKDHFVSIHCLGSSVNCLLPSC